MKHAFSVPWKEGAKDAETTFYVVQELFDGGPKVTVRVDVKLTAEVSRSGGDVSSVLEHVQQKVSNWIEAQR